MTKKKAPKKTSPPDETWVKCSERLPEASDLDYAGAVFVGNLETREVKRVLLVDITSYYGWVRGKLETHYWKPTGWTLPEF